MAGQTAGFVRSVGALDELLRLGQVLADQDVEVLWVLL
jgi:hypothetical protein